MKWIIVDLDGTLCDCSHRIHLRQAKQYEEFNAGIVDDVPVQVVVDFLRLVNWDSALDYKVMLLTGRDEKHRHATVKWLNDHYLGIEFDELIMRPDTNFESDAAVKLQLLDEFFGDRAQALEKVLLILDDRDSVVTAFRDAGFKCWQVAAGSY